MTLDVNVLVATFRQDHPHHYIARQWLLQALQEVDENPIYLVPFVLSSFLRIVSNKRVFVNPSTIEEAWNFLNVLQSIEGVQHIILGEEWATFQKLCLENNAKANDIPDIWLASVSIQYNQCLVSFDADFLKFLPANKFLHLI
ncbi:MAG: PIN domain-containing protein [Pseudomonadales bacterium]|nr:PIN domain-containing protein [Pseudomonadales bacterium]